MSQGDHGYKSSLCMGCSLDLQCVIAFSFSCCTIFFAFTSLCSLVSTFKHLNIGKNIPRYCKEIKYAIEPFQKKSKTIKKDIRHNMTPDSGKFACVFVQIFKEDITSIITKSTLSEKRKGFQVILWIQQLLY